MLYSIIQEPATSTLLSMLLMLLLLLLSFMQCESSSVSFYSIFDNIETSSTLQWAQVKRDHIFEDAVIGAQTRQQSNDVNHINDIFICRVMISNLVLVGQTKNNNQICIVPDLDTSHKSHNFRYLQNIENGSRLEWVWWGGVGSIPKGGLVIEESIDKTRRHFVARKELFSTTKNESYFAFGILIYKDGFGDVMVVNENEEVESFRNGELLIEKQPISYEMKNIEFNKNKMKVKKKNVTLGHAVLSNRKEDNISYSSRVDSLITYEYSYKSSWGRGHAIKTVLPVRIHSENDSDTEIEIGSSTIKWGIDEILQKTELYQIEAHLSAGTALNVTLTANEIAIETPYEATLITHYEDDEGNDVQSNRTIRDVRLLNTVGDLRPVFSPVYYLSNFSLVPIELALVSPTTTAPTTTTSEVKTTDHSNAKTVEESSLELVTEKSEEMSESTRPAIIDEVHSKMLLHENATISSAPFLTQHNNLFILAFFAPIFLCNF